MRQYFLAKNYEKPTDTIFYELIPKLQEFSNPIIWTTLVSMDFFICFMMSLLSVSAGIDSKIKDYVISEKKTLKSTCSF